MADGSSGHQLTTGSLSEGVTVVITCYGYAHLLPEAIDSVLAQTRPPEEVVVVDDGSFDRPLDVARRYAGRGVRGVSRPNGGPGAARNTGASECGTRYLVFLDADDKLEPAYVERTLDTLAACAPGVGYAYTQCRYFGAQHGVSSFPQWDLKRLLRWPFVHASALLRTELVQRYPYDERRRPGVEDWDFYLTLADHGIRGVLVDEPLLLYRKHGGASRGDSLEANPRADVYFRQILRKHWRLGGLKHALHVEGYYARRAIADSVRRRGGSTRRRADATETRATPPSAT